MSYLIIILVLALVLGPVFWIMPSPSQRRQQQFRSQALQQGLQLKVADLPQSRRSAVRQETPQQGMLYRLPWLDRQFSRQSWLQAGEIRCLRLQQGLEWQGQVPAAVQSVVEACLSQLPPSVKALALAADGVGCYWKEQGDVENVRRIAENLAEIRQKAETL